MAHWQRRQDSGWPGRSDTFRRGRSTSRGDRRGQRTRRRRRRGGKPSLPGPDNGLLAAVVEASRAPPCGGSNRGARADRHRRASATFTVGTSSRRSAEIAAGASRRTLSCEGPGVIPGVGGPRGRPSQVAGSVVTIDHFGNLISNIDAAHSSTSATHGAVGGRSCRCDGLLRRATRRLPRAGELLWGGRGGTGGAKRS